MTDHQELYVTQTVESAYQLTKCDDFSPAQHFTAMLKHISVQPDLDADDDFQAALIKACRVRAGL
jgi:hypothetical protein